MTKGNARKKAIRSRMKETGEPYSVAGRHLEEPDGLIPLFDVQAAGPVLSSRQPDHGDQAGSSQYGLWPEEPEPADPVEDSRADRLRLLQHMRTVWKGINAVRHTRVEVEVQAARSRQAEVAGYWDRHRALVKERWATRVGRRGQTTVGDIPEVAAQWHPNNPLPPEKVSATAQQRGSASPYLWQCPLGFSHAPWPAWPKDRIQKGAGCPSCQKLIKLSDIQTLAEQYRGHVNPEEITYGSNDEVPWVCRTWALRPTTGRWERVEHRFKAVVKDRSQQGHGCRVCAGYVIDETNSLATWFPELAEQLDDPQLDARQLATSTHNAARNAQPESGHGEYANVHWRCQHGHRWVATILSRVQGSDCPHCSTSGISKEQVRLVAELAWLMDFMDPGWADPRLPEGLPNFASHKITIPLRFKPTHWRYRDVEVDARFHLPSHSIALGVEYDGAYHHSSELRERSEHEAEKSEVLHNARVVDIVVHVRVGALPPLRIPHALSVSVTERSNSYQQACAVAAAIEARYPGSIPKLAEYLASGRTRGQADADAYILAAWGQLRPPRPKPLRTGPPKQRQLRATAPHSSSLLTPIADPYRNPERPAEIVRDYRCACGNTNPVTAVQAQVTSGNTRSCGCLQEQAKRQKRRPIARAETQAAREWARRNGAEAANGRLPDRVIASYRLHQASRLEILSADGLLEEKRVQEWARAEGLPLAARGRVPSSLWLDFAEDYLAQHGQR
jgi:hypothetical protein